MPNYVEVKPYKIQGELECMASKSMLQRALVLAYLSGGQCIIRNAQLSNDPESLLKSIESLGAISEIEGNQIKINSENLNLSETEINVGESGLALRMMASVLGLKNTVHTIKGEGSLIKRPLNPIIETLSPFGIRMSDQWPIKIQGPLKAGHYDIDGSFSSQILTGLLIALPMCESNSEIHVSQLKSKPYIDMTISAMADFGVECTHENYELFHIAGNKSYQATEFTVEGDWSAAANFMVAAAISGNITITGLQSDSYQADKQVLKALKSYGAEISIIDSATIRIRKKGMIPFNFDATDCPDLFPTLVVLAASCKGRSRIKGTHRLIHKESNRLLTILDLFSKLGLSIYEENDDLIIDGTGGLQGNTVDSHNDHRIVMAAAIAATLTKKPITINNAQAVGKSYPNFFKDLETLK